MALFLVLSSLSLVLTSCDAFSKRSSSSQSSGSSEKFTLTLWSHWADETTKKQFVNEAVDNFKKEYPGADVKITWCQKDQLIQTLTAAFQSNSAPDLFYLEPEITGAFPPFVGNGFMEDISKYVGSYINSAGLPFSQKGKMIYLIPLEAYTPVLYYNKDAFKAAGVTLPQNGKFDMDQLKEAVKKVKDAGYMPMSADRRHTLRGLW